jgi:hypothetical protein
LGKPLYEKPYPQFLIACLEAMERFSHEFGQVLKRLPMCNV